MPRREYAADGDGDVAAGDWYANAPFDADGDDRESSGSREEL